jgi:phthiocerol/phenolphthiocerol synthesis type-I polyketide synthase C
MAETFDDIAILGYACRLPSSANASAFWEVLAEGRCVVSEVSGDRWARERFGHPDRSAPGKTYTWAAGQIDDVWGFDPGFFGISPREAVQIDPQQRLLLQVTWEALEHAGLPPSKLAGTRAGVYVGASSLDYGNQFLFDPAAADVQLMTGNTLSIVSNRISYVLDLRGPSFTVDTACSSSLVALHEAFEAIRTGRIDTAIVAGVNLLLSPLPFVGFSRASMLSPTGLCRAFDADGDGYVRSEGAAVVVLRSAAAAKANGDVIRGLIVGSGINADGRTVGLSLPSSESQADLLAEVYERFAIDPDAVAFIEAHGTGTRVGDPAEAMALGRIIGQRRKAPLPVGSVKTNVGHLEPASGLVGLLKAQLALENDLLPPSLHFHTPNPDIPFGELNLEVVTQARPLPRGASPRYAGVNSFGFGGANAHVVLRDADPTVQGRSPVADAAAPLVVSAQTKEALAELARRYRGRIDESDEAQTARIVNAAAYTRDRLEHRAVFLGRNKAERLAAIDGYLAGTANHAFADGRAIARGSEVAFIFSGNGAQWPGMGRSAYQADRDFRLAFDRIDRVFMGIAGWSLLTALFSPELDAEIERTEIAQPLLFAIQVALAEALARRGVTPAAVAGHSVGEVAAACVCGALSIDQAVRVIHARSTHQEVTRHLGGMAALLMPAEQAAAAIADPRFAGIEIAAINSPRSITISGPSELLDVFAKHARKQRWALKRLDLDYPFHCALVEPIRDPLVGALAGLTPRAGRVPFISAVTGVETPGIALDADYWWQNVRRPVRFEPAVRTLAGMGYRTFLEIGPRPVLTGYVNDTLRTMDVAANVLSSLDKGDDKPDVVGAVAASVLAAGGAVDDAAMFGPRVAPSPDLPTYPWQNKPYRIEATAEAIAAIGGRAHPLLGARLRRESAEWFNHVDSALVPWLADHRVEESVVLPAAGFAEMALSAARAWLGVPAVELADFDIIAPLIVEADAARETMVRISPDDHVIEIVSRSRLTTDDWTIHARGAITRSPGLPETPAPSPADGVRRVTADRLYKLTERFGLRYGPVFRRAHAVDIESDSVATVELAPPDPATATAGFALDPTLLDACFHGLFALLDGREGLDGRDGSTVLPVRFGSLRVAAAGRTPTLARLIVTRASVRSVTARIELFDAGGAVVAVLDGARFQRVKLTTGDRPDDLAYRILPKRLPSRDGVDPFASVWSDGAEAALRELGLVTDDEPDLEEGALLVEAAVRSAALEALRPLLDPAGPVTLEALVDAGKLAADARSLAAGLLIALEEYGIVAEVEDGWRIEDDSELPAVSHIVRTLIAEHPDRIAEATLAARLPTVLAERLAGGLVGSADAVFSAGTLDHLATASPMARPLSGAIYRVAAAIAEAWPDGPPLRILAAGAHDVDLLRRLAALVDPSFMSVTVTDPNNSLLERARLRLGDAAVSRFVPVAEIGAETNAYDLVLSAGRLTHFPPDGLSALARAAAPGGRLVAVELSPSIVLDAICGVGADWWRTGLDAEQGIGRNATAAEWKTTLADAGFGAVTALSLASDLTDAIALCANCTPASVEVAVVEATGRVVVIADAEGSGRSLADAVATAMRSRGRAVTVAVVGTEADAADPDVVSIDLERTGDASVLADLLEGEGRCDLVFALGAADDRVPLAAISRRLDRLGTLLVKVAETRPRLWVLAPGAAQAIAGGPGHRPAQAAAWGFGRVAINEFPDVEIRLIDPAPTLQPGEMAVRIAAEIADPVADREVVIDADRRTGLRIVRGGVIGEAAAVPDGADTGLVLDSTRTGIDGLEWMARARRAPGPGEVEIAVDAAGLNFRDVMWSIGLLPEEALEDGFAGPTIGMECSGTIVRVGPGAGRHAVGDRVISFAPACFASHVTVAERAVAPMPSSVAPEAAATIPVAFLTAYYSLVELARLDEGETVLIHGGAGGVGLAALQIAKWRGATVIATAGSAEKRALLLSLGADHVLNSRSVEFADEVMRLTNGVGVDAVLNSLAGEAMERSLGVVRPFGRFLELGKRDYYANTRIALRPFRRNVSYFGIDADQLLMNKPALADRMFAELVRLFEDGTLTPLPYRRFDAEAVGEAFRLMQQSGHVGKIVVVPPRPTTAIVATPTRTTVRPDRTYLVAGGVGGFGLEAGRWLAARGARHLVLASRSGKLDEAATARVEALRASGCAVRVVACDLADLGSVERLVKSLSAGTTPLAGVLHTAMVLDDALIQNLDAERIGAVLAPKIAGAENLDAATASLQLDLFVMFSSATTLVGNPGQANYVAANAYLEALARRRRAAGKPALAVAWGAIADAGYLARNQEVSALLSRKLGRHALTATEALDGLGRLLDLDPTDPALSVVGYGRIDWAAARKDLALLATPLAERIAIAGGDTETGSATIDLKALVAGLDADRAIETVSRLLAAEIARILRLPADEIDRHRPLAAIGMDSLMALELRMAAEQRMGIDIPLMSLANGATLTDISRRILARIGGDEYESNLGEDAEALAKSHVGDSDVESPDAAAIATAVEEHSRKIRKIIG